MSIPPAREPATRGSRTISTARDVAREAGVHQSTVSRALDPAKWDRVSADTRARVQRAAQRLNYQPDLVARHLRRQRSMSVGIIIPSFGNPVYGELVRGISAELERHDHHALTIESLEEVRGHLAPAIAMLQGRRVDGIVCASASADDADLLERVMGTGMPFVQVLRWVDGRDWVRVINDDERGGALAAEHLLSLGHRRLAQLVGPLAVANFPARSRGFAATATAAGASVVDVTIGSTSVAAGQRGAASLIDQDGDVPTGVFAHNDLLAIGAIREFRARGIDCPERVSVIGYNDIPLTEYLDPPLSTVRMPIDEMGRAAARRVLALIDEKAVKDEVSLVPRLIQRGSTARVAPPLPAA